MCEAHLLLKGCYMPGEHTLILSVVCLPLTGALLTLTHKDVVCVHAHVSARTRLCVCVWQKKTDMQSLYSCVCVCLEVWSGVCPASNLCFGFFNFSPIWGGQVGHCLLHDLGNLCQKGICTVDRSKYVYEKATMATVWCSPGPSTGGIVLTFIYLFSVYRPSLECI